MCKQTLNLSAALKGYYDGIVCSGGIAGCVAALAGASFHVDSSAHDSIVKDRLVPEGILHIPGSMYRIGSVDFDKLVDYLAQRPEKFKPHMVGKMGL